MNLSIMMASGRAIFGKLRRDMVPFTPLISSKMNLSYVERAKYTENLKENKSELLNQLPHGKFLIYNGSRPLLDNADTTSFLKKIFWVPYSDVSRYEEHILESCILLHVDDELKPYFSLQLSKAERAYADSLEESSGTFLDLRMALMSVSWKEGQTLSQANALHMFNKDNSFCGRCGGSTTRCSSGYQRNCSNCKRQMYPFSNPAGIVLITNRTIDSALLVRHSRNALGIYTCVAGFSNVGENLEDTVKREVAEEVGLEVDSICYVASQHWPFPSSLMVGCYAQTDMTEISLDSNELEDAKWFSKNQIEEAYEKSIKTPFFELLKERKDGLLIPPKETLSFHLIKHFVKGTPFNQIRKQIY